MNSPFGDVVAETEICSAVWCHGTPDLDGLGVLDDKHVEDHSEAVYF
ncbi:hypothetical protein WH297_22440 [Ochrobactrum vermis]|uniref:Uncharacterized protein n=1 Tax=Ochrobactrum vermis TaxID=1827297 RepID=A0ABU8PJS6_9HYPH